MTKPIGTRWDRRLERSNGGVYLKDFLKKYGLLIIPAYEVLTGLLSIPRRTGMYLLSFTMADLLMALAIFLSFKAVSKPRKRSKNQLTNACILSVLSVIVGQIPNMMQGGFYISPITIIGVICIIVNAILQKKNIQQKKDATPATEVQEQALPNSVEVKAEAVNTASVAPVAVAESNAENLKGKVLFDSVEDVGDAVITVTDEGFRYVGKALRRGSAKNERVDEFVEYPQIVEFKKTMGVYNITGNGYTFTIAVDKGDKEAIAYIHQRFMQEQNKPHIMKCNIYGQIFTYSFADIDEQIKEMKSAAGSMVGATLTSLATSRLVGSVQSGNAQAVANSAKDKLDALTRCPNCRSKDATEITAEEAAEIRAASAAPVQAASSADELKKFKELLDSGIITQEEFDAKEKQLLGL